MYVYVYIHIYICLYTYIYVCVYIYMPHLFIHSSADGHLGGLHVMAIVNSAAVNTGVHISFFN